MKEVLKYTFDKIKKVTIDEEGNPVVKESEPVTLFFSLLNGGHALFEQLYGMPVIRAINQFNIVPQEEVDRINREITNEEARKKALTELSKKASNEQLLKMVYDSKFILALASSSYLKQVNGELICNQFTVSEFMDMEIVNSIVTDTEFISQLLEMAMNCINGDENKKKKTNTTNSKKKIKS